MKITDVEVIKFRTTTRWRGSKWWEYGIWGDEVDNALRVSLGLSLSQ